MLVPKLFTTLRSYDRAQLTADLTAGVVVGIVALPLSIAFAIASGVSPDRGLYTAIVAGFLISALGGSRVQIGGPTGAFVVIVYGIVQEHGLDGLAVATVMAGLILVALGLARLGGAIKFIPFPVVTGFTSGIALIIFSSQVKDLLGLRMGEVPAEFFAKWAAYARSAGSFDPAALAVSAAALAILLGWPRVSRRVPGPFVALLATTAGARLLGLEVETIGSRFGAIPSSLPAPSLPHVDPAMVRELMGPALTIALLAAIESLLSAVVADGMIGGKHRSDMELVAQGVANVASPLFGGIPATGAIARTATNVNNGGRTPVAGITHAATLLLITLFFGRWAAYIPLATLAAILVVVAYHMSEWRTFRSELSAPRSDVAVLLATFVLTVVVDLTVAIQVGMVLAAFLFMKRMAEVTSIAAITRELNDDDDEDGVRGRAAVPKGVEVYAIDGPFFFGAAERFKETMGTIGNPPRVLVLEMTRVPAMDSTGLRALASVVRRARKDGTRVILAGVHAQPMAALARSELLGELGEHNLRGTVDEALAEARRHLGIVPFGGIAGAPA
ncbi:MAG TPA: SulP family inorganic anion transporter, partial [Longimicrobiaceae bacterium]